MQTQKPISRVLLVVDTPNSPYGHRFLMPRTRLVNDLAAAQACAGLQRPGPARGPDWLGYVVEVRQVAFSSGRTAHARAALAGFDASRLHDGQVAVIQSRLAKLLTELPSIETQMDWSRAENSLVVPCDALDAAFDTAWDKLPTLPAYESRSKLFRPFAYGMCATAACLLTFAGFALRHSTASREPAGQLPANHRTLLNEQATESDTSVDWGLQLQNPEKSLKSLAVEVGRWLHDRPGPVRVEQVFDWLRRRYAPAQSSKDALEAAERILADFTSYIDDPPAKDDSAAQAFFEAIYGQDATSAWEDILSDIQRRPYDTLIAFINQHAISTKSPQGQPPGVSLYLLAMTDSRAWRALAERTNNLLVFHEKLEILVDQPSSALSGALVRYREACNELKWLAMLATTYAPAAERAAQAGDLTLPVLPRRDDPNAGRLGIDARRASSPITSLIVHLTPWESDLHCRADDGIPLDFSQGQHFRLPPILVIAIFPDLYDEEFPTAPVFGDAANDAFDFRARVTLTIDGEENPRESSEVRLISWRGYREGRQIGYRHQRKELSLPLPSPVNSLSIDAYIPAACVRLVE